MESVRQYMTDVQGPWLSELVRRQRAAIEAYARTARLAPSGESEVRVIAEAEDMTEALAQTFLESARAVVPTELAQDPKVLAAYVAHLEKAVWPLLEETLAYCVGRADARAVHTAEAERCRHALATGRARQAEVASIERSAQQSSSSEPLPPGPTRRSPRAPWSETTHPSRCVFGGSIQPGEVVLQGDPIADRPILSLFDFSEVRVERFELPETPGARYKVVLAYPVRATAWLDGRARPFALPHRVDLVPGHVWIDAGVHEPARRVGPDRAAMSLESATEDLSLGTRPAPAPLVVACDDLHFARQHAIEPVASATWHHFSADGWTPLFDAPDGRQAIARARRFAARELARAGAFTRVTTRGEDVSFDAWARSSDFVDADAGLIGLIRQDSGAAYRAARGVEPAVRLRPDRAAPAIGVLAPGAEVRVTKEVSTFYEVLIPDLSNPTGESHDFFVDRAALEPAPP
ncbi:MAG TPA: hypothetical protein VE987_15045 [Polyangiaceae bacterium]|nr:hypothetical protein [Polyangiaceae bacterium]